MVKDKKLSRVATIGKLFLEALVTDINDMVKVDVIYDQIRGDWLKHEKEELSNLHMAEATSQLKRQGIIQKCGMDGRTPVYKVGDRSRVDAILSGAETLKSMSTKQIQKLQGKIPKKVPEEKVETPKEEKPDLSHILENLPDVELSAHDIGNGMIAIVEMLKEQVHVLTTKLQIYENVEVNLRQEKRGRIDAQRKLSETERRLQVGIEEQIQLLRNEKIVAVNEKKALEREIIQLKQAHAEQIKNLESQIDELCAKLANKDLQEGKTLKLSSLKELGRVKGTFKPLFQHKRR